MKKLVRLRLVGCLTVLLVMGNFVSGRGRPLTDSLQISLITSDPGQDLYTTFGHSAVRVQDYSTGADYIFNYGTFDFSTPHFYWKFVRGRLMYFLSVQQFPDFLQAYKAEGRKITEQVLNLNAQEKQRIFDYLKTNYLPDNRYYKYDFLFDNCATRISDIIADIFDGAWEIGDIIPQKRLTFRQIINAYLKSSPWERLGINLMFGRRADQAMSNREVMFLPDFLMKGFAHSSVDGAPLVKRTKLLFEPANETKESYPFYKKPLLWFSLLGLFILFLSFKKPSSFLNMLMPWIDRCLFFLTGLLGCFLLFMWIGTDHKITVWNYNLLWLLPTNIVFSFYFFKDNKWVRVYALLLLGINILLLAGWFLLPQQLPLVAIPLIVAISSRAWKIATRIGKSY